MHSLDGLIHSSVKIRQPQYLSETVVNLLDLVEEAREDAYNSIHDAFYHVLAPLPRFIPVSGEHARDDFDNALYDLSNTLKGIHQATDNRHCRVDSKLQHLT